MDKLFGEFLIEKNKLTIDQLAEALIIQIHETLSYPEIIYKYDLLESKKLVAILNYQRHHGIDFKKASLNLGFWTSDLEAKIINHLRSTRRPLGEIFVDMGILTLESLTEYLDLYIDLFKEKPEINHKDDIKMEIEVKQIDDTLFEEFILNFETKLEPILNDICKNFMVNWNKASDSTIKHILVEFVGIKASCDFINLNKTSELCGLVLDICKKILQNKSSYHPEKIKEMIVEVKDILKNNKEQFKLSRSESSIQSNSEYIQKLRETFL